MTSFYNQALREKTDNNIITQEDLTYVNRGSNAIESNSPSDYLWKVYKKATENPNVQGYDLWQVAIANVGNPQFPEDCWEHADMTFLDLSPIIMPNLKCLKAALYIDMPKSIRRYEGAHWYDFPNLSSKKGKDDPVHDCNIGHYVNDYGRCVPSLTYYRARERATKFEASKSGLIYEASKPDFSASLRRKESDEPGVEEDGSNTLLYIAGAGVLGAITYMLLKGKK